MRRTEKYTFFWKDKLAQWNMQSFIVDNIKYCCAEQYMMAKKAELFEDYETLEKIMNSNSPKEHQSLGRIVKNYDEKIWNENKENIVFNGNIHKFLQNDNLCEILLSTKDTILVEASPIDKIWGVGLDENDDLILDEKNWKGLNLLGKTLMKVREYIIKNKLKK